MKSEDYHHQGSGEAGSLLDLPGVEEVRALLQEMDPWVLETQMELTGIPAPPFGEGPRGNRMAELFEEVGLSTVRKDEVGNVLAELPGASTDVDQAGGPGLGGRSGDSAQIDSQEPEGDLCQESGSPSAPFIVSAHLDTVFPPGTDVSPRRSEDMIRAPGIADDGRGLAALLALGRVLTRIDLPLPSPLLFVATVGEEGAGNLGGARNLFRDEGPGAGAQGFISLDGVGLGRIITRGVGSTRLRLTLRGPGGHSWTDWGLPNPIHALGRIVSGLDALPLPTSPRTTATVARWGGGKSINAIPQEAWVEVDLRSEGETELRRAEEALLHRCAREAESSGGGGRGSGARLVLEITDLGRRPAGATPKHTPLVQAAAEATRALGVEPQLIASSTDANIPMALGIPAITLGAGGRAGGIHTRNEWYSNWKGPEGILRAVLTLTLLG